MDKAAAALREARRGGGGRAHRRLRAGERCERLAEAAYTRASARCTCCATTPGWARAPRAGCGSTSPTTGSGPSRSTSGACSTASRPSCRGCWRPGARTHRQHLIRGRRHRPAAHRLGVRGDQGRRGDHDRVALRPAARRACAEVGASVLFPGPHMLRTGLWESHRNRPDRYAKEPGPGSTPYRSLDQWEAAMAAAGQRDASSPRSRKWPGRWSDGIRGRPLLDAAAERAQRPADPGQRPSRCWTAANPGYLERFILDGGSRQNERGPETRVSGDPEQESVSPI